MNVKVKICGIRSEEALKVAIESGADFIGLNFVPRSKRYLDLSTAKALATIAKHQVSLVGVFENASIEDIINVLNEVPFDYIQLHGDEDISLMQRLNKKIIKRVDFETADKYENISEFLLLDRQEQGKGMMVDVDHAKEISSRYPLFFSGGLTPENVSSIVKKVKPYAVDVAGGIETNGKEDMFKIRQFIINAKGVTV